MQEAIEESTTRRATWASVDFRGYQPGAASPFYFDVSLGYGHGRSVYGPARMTRDAAVTAALNILAIAAVMDGKGLSDEEREKLKTLSAREPMFGTAAVAAA